MPEITSRLSTALADRYKIERHLGEGGMATVYLAEDLKHKRKVAVRLASLVVSLLFTVGCATKTSRIELSTEPSELCSDHPDAAIATFEDANLEAEIRTALSVAAQENLTCGLISGLTGLATLPEKLSDAEDSDF